MPDHRLEGGKAAADDRFANGRAGARAGERTGTMDFAKASRRPRGWRREVLTAAAVGAFLGVIGPFGSFSAEPFFYRIAYWLGAALLGTLLFGTAVRIVAAQKLRLAWSVAAVLVLSALLSLPFALIAAVVARALWPQTGGIAPLHWYLQVLAVAAPLCTAWIWFAGRDDRRGSALAEVDRQTSPLGVEPASVLCLQMEDHYVRVHHQSGSELVLATMRQAQQTLHRVPGLQVHRSWWVAATAVAEPVLEGRNLRLRLTNGLLVPVSRQAVASVRAAGWLNRNSC